MSRYPVVTVIRSLQAAVFFWACFTTVAVLAHETQEKIADPGFRPDSPGAAAFIASFDTATVAVYPSIVRRTDRTAYSYESRGQIIASLNEAGTSTAIVANSRIDVGRIVGQSQWEWFQDGMRAVAGEVQRKARDVDYSLVMEFMFPPGNEYIFGIHVFVLDRNGENAFSFLLNSHHRSFVDAKLTVEDSSETAHTQVIERATELGLAALRAQVDQVRECMGRAVVTPDVMPVGIFDDFESGLPAGTNESGVPLGFSTFSDGTSAVNISTTTSFPPRSGDDADNTVLKMDLKVTGWAGFVHTFGNDEVGTWNSYDWSRAGEISFWLYGQDSGTSLFVDILDNRRACSTVDDAERYGYTFTDDVAGWRQITIRFADMQRKEIHNNAPDDGFTLSEVHGWAFGALKTPGKITFYIDHVGLGEAPAAGADYPINELPMYGHLTKSAAQKLADDQYIEYATSGGRSREEAADIAAKTGWDYYYKGDQPTAIKRFNQAWLLDPENPLALWGFAGISRDRDQIDEAIRYFEMAIQRDPEDAKLRHDYQDTLLQMRQREQAIAIR